MKHLDPVDYYKIFGLYLCMIVVRFVAIGLFMPILKRIAYGLTWIEVLSLNIHIKYNLIGCCIGLWRT